MRLGSPGEISRIFRLEVFNGLQGVFAVPNDDNPTDRFGTLLVQGPSSQSRAKTHFRHMTDINGDVVSDGDDASLDVFQGLDEANATNVKYST